MRYAIVRVAPAPARPPAGRLDLESFARTAGLHPELVRRLVALGLLSPIRDSAGTVWFPGSQLAEAARLQRLRAGLGLNYAALALVVDLLDRIAEMEATLRSRSAPGTARRGPLGPDADTAEAEGPVDLPGG
ncbi:MAG: chaperone modulatory protein CbpM [Acidimicrobiaceae bacterium]|jgi:chaperone modulatory protein CbpM